MNGIKRIFFLTVLSLITIASFAQEAVDVSKTDFMNSNGKIFVVLAVVVVIVLGLFIYLFALDRRMTKLEKEEK